ncbi:hypothetical protein V5799_028133 [Amblyomma americanum]|uniref:Nlr family card domain protein n=1 Tax=Amblyomma americanum TaxID=6943 RepID=A0AAQ4DDQ9_AMBAM
MHIVSTHNWQAWRSIFFLAWLPRKHRCVHFLAVRRSLPRVPYSVWRLAPEESRFGAGKQCHLRHVTWNMDLENWGLLELFQEDATKLETLEVSFGQGTKAVIPDEFRQLVRRSSCTLQTFRIYMSSHSDACERLGVFTLCQSLAELDIVLTGAVFLPEKIARILSSNSALQKLSFYYPPYSHGDREFADALTRSRTLLEVHVASPSIEAFGVVCDALTENSSVRMLSLACMLPRGQLMTPDDKVASLLRGNTVLESLTLAGFRCFIEDPDSVAGALGDNAALKSLTCAADCTVVAGVLSRLVAALERNKTLQRIQVDAVFGSREQRDVWLVVDIQPEQASALRTALAGPDRIPLRGLSLWSVRRWPHCMMDAVKEIIVSNSSLESLEIAEDIRSFDLAAYCQDLIELSSAVWSSSNLSHLTIVSSDHLYHAEYARWLVAVLRNSKSIVSLSVSQQKDNYSGQRAFNVMALGLLLNQFVVDIDIDGPVQDTRDYIFSRTVTRNRTRVNDAARFVTGKDSSSRMALAALVASLECSQRIEVQYWDDGDLLTMMPMLTAPLATPRDVWLVVDDIQPEQASALRTALAGPDRIPLRGLSLWSVRRWPHCMMDAVKEIIVSNSSLESLEIAEDIRSFDLAAYCQDLIELSSAVWSSSNLSNLTIVSSDHLYHAEYARWLVALLRNSKSIVSLSVSQQKDNYSGQRAFNVMAMGLLLNQFVVDIDIDGPVQDTRDYIFSRTVTRNRTRVNDAARFVTGKDSSSRCARAFELLRTKHSLLRLITRVTRETEDDARAAIRTAFGRMRDNFLRSAGVVRSSVMCWPADVTQIDALNMDCWCAISRYLKLHDVLARHW